MHVITATTCAQFYQQSNATHPASTKLLQAQPVRYKAPPPLGRPWATPCLTALAAYNSITVAGQLLYSVHLVYVHTGHCCHVTACCV